MPTYLQIKVPNLVASQAYYSKLNFKLLRTKPTPILQDGNLLLELNPDRVARVCVQLFVERPEEVLSQLPVNSLVAKGKDHYLLGDPNGI